MNERGTPDAFGVLTEPATLTIKRLLPGPIDRVWAYLTDSELRRKWLASGKMELKVGAPFEFVWRNDELTDPPGQRPSDKAAEHRLQSRILEIDPPRKLGFTFGPHGEVSIELKEQGDNVMLTLTHRRLPDRATTLMVGAGWHMHLDIMVARISDTTTEPFWDGWNRLRKEYDRRVPA
jgi:uncharacterized protein YndB with AHSA1/START domain